MNILNETLILLIPLIVGGIAHMIAVTLDILKFLKIPVGEKAFGKNKTIRGFVLMPLFTIPGVYLAIYLSNNFGVDIGIDTISPLLLGVLLGLSYCLFELPNSYYKRRKGIEPGKSSNENKLLHAVVDQVDSGFGLVIIYYFYTKATVAHLFLFLLIGTIVHLLLNLGLYKLGLRKEPL